MNSLFKVDLAKIGRASEKYRNKKNKHFYADLKALSQLASIKKSYFDDKNGIHYSAILTGMPTCLKCHGGIEDILIHLTPTFKKLFG